MNRQIWLSCVVASFGGLTWIAADFGQESPPAGTARLSSLPASEPTSSTRATGASTRPGGGIVAPPRRNVPGRRAALAHGSLFVPDYFQSGDQQPVNVVIWFLGATWCAEQVFYDANKNAVLVVAGGKDLAGAFRDPAALPALLDEMLAELKHLEIANGPVGHVCLASFSGGYVGVREVLRQPRSLRLVSDVVLADSLYAPRTPPGSDHLDEDSMRPFLDYARRAHRGECGLWFSHLYPPEKQYRGNTTTLAASYLIDELKLKRETGSGQNSRGARLLYRAEGGGVHILGYAGMSNQDHFDHFYAAGDLLKKISFEPAVHAQRANP